MCAQPITQSTFARALDVGMAVDAAWRARQIPQAVGAAMAPASYLPASFLQHPAASGPGGNPADAALPASAPAYTAAAATGGYGVKEDYVTPSPQQLYSRSLPEGASLFISHLEERPSSNRPHTVEGLVQVQCLSLSPLDLFNLLSISLASCIKKYMLVIYILKKHASHRADP